MTTALVAGAAVVVPHIANTLLATNLRVATFVTISHSGALRVLTPGSSSSIFPVEVSGRRLLSSGGSAVATGLLVAVTVVRFGLVTFFSSSATHGGGCCDRYWRDDSVTGCCNRFWSVVARAVGSFLHC
ncbi:hypothetical protein Hanom_Chr06g00512641 [Helianthus anomalus]